MVDGVRVMHNRNDMSMDAEVSKQSATGYSNFQPLRENNLRQAEMLDRIRALRSDVAWQYYQRQKQSQWTADEIDFFQDALDWRNKLSDVEQHYLRWLFVSLWDGHSVLHAYLSRGLSRLHSSLALRYFYTHYLGVLNVHAEVYMRMLSAISEGEELARGSVDFDDARDAAVVELTRWLDKWMDFEDVGKLLFSFVVGETCWLRVFMKGWKSFEEKGWMPGLSMAHALIERDKGLHLALVATLFRKRALPFPPKTWRSGCVSHALQRVEHTVDGVQEFKQSMLGGLRDMADILWGLVEVLPRDGEEIKQGWSYTTATLDQPPKGTD